MLKTIALTMGIIGAMSLGMPVLAQEHGQIFQDYQYQHNNYWTPEELYLIQKSCEWLLANDYTMEELYRYFSKHFYEIRPSHFSPNTTESFIESGNKLARQAADIKAAMILHSAVDLIGASSGKCR